MAKVLVTGAAGFIGSFLSRALISRGDDVVGVDNFHGYYHKKAKELNLDLIRFLAGDEPNNFDSGILERISKKINNFTSSKTNPKSGNFAFYEADVRDPGNLEVVFKNEDIDKIIHLAAMAGVPYSLEKPKEYYETNVNGTVNLMELSKDYGIKNFVFGSSSSVYGGRTDTPFREDDSVSKPISHYAATKKMAEVSCFTYHYLFNLPTTIARIFGPIYGPLQRPYGMAAQRFIKQVYRNEPMTIFGDGTMGRDSTYIDDIAAGLIKCLDKDFSFEIINIGSGRAITVLDLANYIKKLLGRGEIIHIDKPPTEVPITFADISKARKLLGYEPKIKFEEGIKKQLEVFDIMPQWYKDLPG